MTKHLNFILLVLAFAGFSGSAQPAKFSVTKSEIFKDEYKQSVFVLAEKEADGKMLFVRYYESGGISPGDGLYIERYGPDLKLDKEFEFSTRHPNHEKYNMIIGVFASSGLIRVIELYYDLNEKSVICRSNNITHDFKTSTTELFRIAKEQLQEMGSFSMQSIYFDRAKELWTNSNSGDIKSETDLSKSSSTFPRINSNVFMVVNEEKTAFAIALDIKQSNSKFLKLYSFDSNLQKKIDTHLTRDFKDEKYIFGNAQVAKDANEIYVLGKSYDEQLRKKEAGAKYRFELVRVTPASQNLIAIDPKQHFISYLRPYLHNDKIVCLGFFSDFDDRNTTGVCSFTTDLQLSQLESEKFSLFSPQPFADKYGSDVKKYKALTKLSLREVVFIENGEIFISAEQESMYAESSGVGIGVGTKTKITYEYDDILSVKLNPDREIEWARVINKDQTRSDEDSFYISHTSTVKNGVQYYFINADKQPKVSKEDRLEFRRVSMDESNLTLLKVNPVGDLEFGHILTASENAVPFMVSKGITIGNDVYFLGRKNKEKQLLKVTLE